MTLYIHIDSRCYPVKPGDTLANIAKRYGNGSSLYLSELVWMNKANLQAMGLQPAQVHMALTPSFCLWLPPQDANSTLSEALQAAMRYHNRQSYDARQNFSKLIDFEYDLMGLSSAALLIAGVQRLRGMKPDPILNGGAVGALALAEQFVGHMKEQAKELNDAMLNIEAQAKATLQVPVAERKPLIDAYYKAHVELNKKFNVEIATLNKMQRASKKIVFLNDPDKMLKWSRYKKSFSVVSTDAYKTVSDFGRQAKFVTRTFAAFEVLGVAVDTIQTAENGGAWGKELFEGLSDIAGGSVGGWMIYAVAPLVGAAGWWLIIPAAGMSLGLSEVFKIIAEYLDRSK